MKHALTEVSRNSLEPVLRRAEENWRLLHSRTEVKLDALQARVTDIKGWSAGSYRLASMNSRPPAAAQAPHMRAVGAYVPRFSESDFSFATNCMPSFASPAKGSATSDASWTSDAASAARYGPSRP